MTLPEKNSFSNLGGELEDYSPVTDPTTDLSADADNDARADNAAMTRTITRAWVSFTVDGYGEPTVSNSDFDAVYGNAQIYKPTVSLISAGLYLATFPTSVIDARGIERTINFQCGWCNNDDLEGYITNAKLASANTFRILNWSTQHSSLRSPSSASVKLTLFVI